MIKYNKQQSSEEMLMKKVLLIFCILLLPFSLSLSFNFPSFIWNYVSSYQTDEQIYWKVNYTQKLIKLIEDYLPFLEKSGISLPITSNVEVHFIDVGQGDSVYIKLPNNVDILIDGGNNWYGDDVVTYLKSQDVDDIEYLIATHPDADHIGGLDDVLKAFEVENVYAPDVSHTTKTYNDFVLEVRNEGTYIKTTKAGMTLINSALAAVIGCPSFSIVYFLGPVKNYGTDLNSWSAVMKLDFGNSSYLFTGDADRISEKDMIDNGMFLKADVLKVGHHGSYSSTSKEFLKEVSPKYAVISVGKNNNYGHPAQEVLERLEMYKVDLFRTDLQGHIIAISDGNKINFNVEPINTVNLMEDAQESAPQKTSILITNLDVSDEKVTICNNTDEDVDLTGWVLVSEVGNQKFNFPDGYVLRVGECVNILSGRNAIDEPPVNLKWTGVYIWNNDSDIAVLYDAEGTLISRLEF